MRHYWRKAILKSRQDTTQADSFSFALVACDANSTLSMLSKSPQTKLGWFATHFAFLTTPFKRIGISGWKETGCNGEGVGVPVRDAQHSTDGFWTIDFSLQSFEIRGMAGAANRFVRVEVEPNTAAHAFCESAKIVAGMIVSFSGPVVVDEDGPFLEVHPDPDFKIRA
jgi:hypothetical protein